MQDLNFKFGIISEVKPGFAKVYFEADDIVTDWFPVLQRTSLQDKESWPLNVKEHVVCLCDKHCEEGVVLGAIYSNADTPDPGAADGKFRKLFSDGTYLEYDKDAHQLTASVQGKVSIVATSDIDATTQTNINASATIQVVITAPLIQLNGNVTVGGTLSAGSLALAPIAGNAGADGKVHGSIEVTGSVTADTDVIAGGKSLKTHTHTSPSGGGITSAPN